MMKNVGILNCLLHIYISDSTLLPPGGFNVVVKHGHSNQSAAKQQASIHCALTPVDHHRH